MCLGISPELEGEEGAVANSDGGGDKIDLKLPGMQEELLAAVDETVKLIVAVITNGSPLELNFVAEKADAVLEAWYPGQEGGNTVTDILFGDYNPSTKLPVSFVRSVDQLPEFTDYSMQDRTYRFMDSDPLYPFGFGLSYTDFEYSNLEISPIEFNTNYSEKIKVKLKIKNIGKMFRKEIVQLYFKDLKASVITPKYELRGVKILNLAPGEEREVNFNLNARDFAIINNQGKAVLKADKSKIFVGGSQPDQYRQKLSGKNALSKEIKVSGKNLELNYSDIRIIR